MKEVTVAVMNKRRYVEIQDDLVVKDLSSAEVRRIVERRGIE